MKTILEMPIDYIKTLISVIKNFEDAQKRMNEFKKYEWGAYNDKKGKSMKNIAMNL